MPQYQLQAAPYQHRAPQYHPAQNYPPQQPIAPNDISQYQSPLREHAVPDHVLQALLDSFSDEELRGLLLIAAQRDGLFVNEIRATHANKLQAELQRDIDFSHYSNEISSEIFDYDETSGSRAYEVAFEVKYSVEEKIEKLRDSVKPHSSFGTKQSALETLRKICNTICTCGDYGGTLPHEVQKSFQYSDILENSMLKILSLMTLEERQRMASDNGGECLTKLRELLELGERYCMLNKVPNIIDLLDPTPGDDESSTGSSDEEYYKKVVSRN